MRAPVVAMGLWLLASRRGRAAWRGPGPAQPGAILFNTNPACLSTLGLLD